MKFSDFGQNFEGYAGITHLMDDLSEGLAQEDMIMLGGGNPAAIPQVMSVYNNLLSEVQQSGALLKTLANYDGPQGNQAFIRNLAELFKQQYGWKISHKNIALTHGSQSAFFLLFNSFAGKARGAHQQVLVPLVPEYIGYCDVGVAPDLIKSQAASIVHLEDGFFKYQVDFDNLPVDKSTGLICVSRPTNPSGNVLTDAEIQRLDQIARDNNVPLMIDNAYGTPFPNIVFSQINPFWNENCIVCMSLSKLGLPGARTGIIIANEEVIQYFTNLTATSSLAPSGIGATLINQLIIDKALLPLCDNTIKPFYQKRAALAVGLLRAAIDDPRLHIHKPEGSIFLWLWFEDLSIPTSQLYQQLKQKGLLVVPGKYFFPGQSSNSHGESCIRLNYVQDEAALCKGINILAETLRPYWKN